MMIKRKRQRNKQSSNVANVDQKPNYARRAKNCTSDAQNFLMCSLLVVTSTSSLVLNDRFIAHTHVIAYYVHLCTFGLQPCY